jgi:hypothetical protein
MHGLLRSVIAITERDLIVVNPFQTAIRNRDAEDIAAKVIEDFVARAGMLGMDDPGFLPHVGIDETQQARFLESGAHFGGKDNGKGFNRDEEFGIFRFNPPAVIESKATGGDQHVNVGVVEHGARPGMKHCQSPEASAEESRVGGKFLQRISGSFHQQTVDDFGMRSGESAQAGWERECDQVVATGQQALTLLGNPALGLILVTLRATAVAAGVVGIPFLLAMVTLIDVASKEGGATVRDIAERLFLNRSQLRSELRTILIPVEADNVSNLQQEDLDEITGPA